MKLKSFFKRLILIEEVVEKFNSPINGEILVYEDLFGKHSMRIGGVSQSGGLVVDIWKTVIKQILNFKFEILNQFSKDTNFKCLILGLGCGNAASMVSKTFPKAEIVGVEIDPVVIEVGKKYFDLDKIPNLNIVIGNALTPTSYKLTPTSFDLILIDLYLGQNFPKEAESEEFIEGLKKFLNKDGIVVFSRFNWGKYKKQAQDFKKELEKYFPQIWTQKTVSNLLIFCKYDTISSVNKESHT